MSLREWIIEWIVENVGVDREEVLIHTEENYFELGWMDSYTYVGFISELEEHFHIQIAREDISNPISMSVEGMTQILNKEGKLDA